MSSSPPSTRRLIGLYRYPIKSCHAETLQTARIEARGIEGDRDLMLIDSSQHFVTQREQPRMALVRAALGEGILTVSAPGMQALSIDLVPDGARLNAQIWQDTCVVIDVGDIAAEWFATFLGMECRLVRWDDSFTRRVDPAYAAPDAQVGFTDGFSLLLTLQSSLDALNAKLTTPLPMSRFRPNLVVDGIAAFEEDAWRSIAISGVRFSVAKPCARCKITTVDQETAQVGKEPLRTLARFRRSGAGVMFGQNLVHHGAGNLRVGATVLVHHA